MLAPARLSLRQHWFNLRWGAPSGRPSRGLFTGERRLTSWAAKTVGYFAFQTNNTTRKFEYPWAFDALQVRPGLRILEIGGGLAGLQFVLDRAGCEVVNVDPGDGLFNPSWPPTTATMVRLNKLFGTNVRMLNCFLHEARFPDESFESSREYQRLRAYPPRHFERHLERSPPRAETGWFVGHDRGFISRRSAVCRCRIESLWTQCLSQMDSGHQWSRARAWETE